MILPCSYIHVQISAQDMTYSEACHCTCMLWRLQTAQNLWEGSLQAPLHTRFVDMPQLDRLACIVCTCLGPVPVN
jgi:hypothetical protein